MHFRIFYSLPGLYASLLAGSNKDVFRHWPEFSATTGLEAKAEG